MRQGVRFGVVVAILAFSLSLPAAALADRAFSVRFGTNDTGNIAIAAAPLLACSTTGFNGAQCAAARNLDPSTAGPSGANNNSYGGGPGRVATHGRDGASLLDPLGSAASHGCVRVPDRFVRLLARRAREGTLSTSPGLQGGRWRTRVFRGP
jgi:hypothetical protein